MLFGSCSNVQQLQVESINQFQVIETSKGEITFGIDATVYNPNSFTIKVKDFDLKLKINNVNLGKANIDRKFKLKGKSTESYYFEVKVKVGNMLFGALPLIASLSKDKQAKIHLEGKVKASVMGIPKKVKVGIEKDVTLRK